MDKKIIESETYQYALINYKDFLKLTDKLNSFQLEEFLKINEKEIRLMKREKKHEASSLEPPDSSSQTTDEKLILNEIEKIEDHIHKNTEIVKTKENESILGNDNPLLVKKGPKGIFLLTKDDDENFCIYEMSSFSEINGKEPKIIIPDFPKAMTEFAEKTGIKELDLRNVNDYYVKCKLSDNDYLEILQESNLKYVNEKLANKGTFLENNIQFNTYYKALAVERDQTHKLNDKFPLYCQIFDGEEFSLKDYQKVKKDFRKSIEQDEGKVFTSLLKKRITKETNSQQLFVNNENIFLRIINKQINNLTQLRRNIQSNNKANELKRNVIDTVENPYDQDKVVLEKLINQGNFALFDWNNPRSPQYNTKADKSFFNGYSQIYLNSIKNYIGSDASQFFTPHDLIRNRSMKERLYDTNFLVKENKSISFYFPIKENLRPQKSLNSTARIYNSRHLSFDERLQNEFKNYFLSMFNKTEFKNSIDFRDPENREELKKALKSGRLENISKKAFIEISRQSDLRPRGSGMSSEDINGNTDSSVNNYGNNPVTNSEKKPGKRPRK